MSTLWKRRQLGRRWAESWRKWSISLTIHDPVVPCMSLESPAGGTHYTETGLAVAASALVTLSDLERYKDLALSVGAVGVVSATQVQHFREIGLAVPVSALVTAAEAQHFRETGLAVPVVGTLSATDAKKYSEAGLQITAVGTVAEADAQRFLDVGLAVGAAGTLSLTDALHAIEAGLPVSIVGTATAADVQRYREVALAVPAAAVLDAAVAQHYQDLGLAVPASASAILADIQKYTDGPLAVSVAAVVSLASEVFHAASAQEHVALTAAASVSVTDAKRYLETSLPVSAQAVLAGVDAEHYQDALQVLIAATLTATDVQHWAETLEALATGQVLLTDAQRYREIGLLVGSVATVGVVDEVRLSRLGLPVIEVDVPLVQREFEPPWVGPVVPVVHAFPGEASLRHNWRLNESSGTRADAIGGATLSPVGSVGSDAGLVYGLSAHVIRANGEYLESSVPPDTLSITGPFTLEVWVRLHSFPSGGLQGVFVMVNEYRCYWNDASGIKQFFVEVFDSVPGSVIAYAPGPAILAGEWHQLIFWYDPADKAARLVLDNGTVGVSSSLTTGPRVGVNGFRVARAGAQSHDGDIGPLRVWGALLADEERTALWNQGWGLECPRRAYPRAGLDAQAVIRDFACEAVVRDHQVPFVQTAFGG